MSTITHDLVACARDGVSRVALIVAAAGEGKSTTLLQVATAMAETHSWKVLWRADPDVELDVRAIGNLPPGPWLLAADNAAPITADLHASLQRREARGLSDVHFLVASRDTDWIAARGDDRAWGAALHKFRLSEVDELEAQSIVRAWGRVGEAGLRRLSTLATEDERTAALLDASAGLGSRAKRSLFGAVLAARFAPADLRAHLQDLLNGLAAAPVGPGRTLRDALLPAAALDAIDIEGVDRDVLADMLNIPRDAISTLILRPLGSEAAGTLAGRHVQTRHRDIGRVILGLAEESNSVEDVAELYAHIVRQAIITAATVSVRMAPWLGHVAHVGPRLVRSLPREYFDAERRLEIGVRAAEAAIYASNRRRLVHYVTLARTWRAGDRPKEGARVLLAIVDHIRGMLDYRETARGAWTELAVCIAGTEDVEGGALVAAYAISDELNDADLPSDQAGRALAGLGAAFRTLASTYGGEEFSRALRAAAVLGGRTNPDSVRLGYFRDYGRRANEMGVPEPDVDQAMQWLRSGVLTAKNLASAPELPHQLRDAPLTFQALGVVVEGDGRARSAAVGS